MSARIENIPLKLIKKSSISEVDAVRLVRNVYQLFSLCIYRNEDIFLIVMSFIKNIRVSLRSTIYYVLFPLSQALRDRRCLVTDDKVTYIVNYTVMNRSRVMNYTVSVIYTRLIIHNPYRSQLR